MSMVTALDLLVVGLLMATIAYAVVLNRRLGQLRDGRADMERLINDFYQATTRAESGVMALKEAAGISDTDAIGKLDSLTKVHNELEFLVARAERESTKLEGLIREGRGRNAKASPTTTRVDASTSGLDAELFGDPKNVPGSGQPLSQRASRPAATSISAAIQELR